MPAPSPTHGEHGDDKETSIMLTRDQWCGYCKPPWEEWQEITAGQDEGGGGGEHLSAFVVQEIAEKTTNRWRNPTHPMITALHTSPSTHKLKKAGSNI